MGKAYFNDADFPEMENEFVLWVDIMGTKNNMSSSVRTSSIFICKLHVAIMEAKRKGMHMLRQRMRKKCLHLLKKCFTHWEIL